MDNVRILFIADTHLGFDLPFQPRVQRRRRGPDFFENFEHALRPAFNGEVHCVVHGGDILYRSRVPPKLVEMAFEPLKQLADTGMPVFVVPGNHERSQIPYPLLAAHPEIRIFDRPRTHLLEIEGFRLALTGFPCERKTVRADFPDILEQTRWRELEADGRLLCMHQCVEGATVGPGNYTFRDKPDVIRAADIPSGFAAILAGHIHRFQVLTKDLRGNPLPAPVLYPGSIERTSFAEKDEKKGYLIAEIETKGPRAGFLGRWTFHELPARPMILLELHANGLDKKGVASWVKNSLGKLDPDGVVNIRVHGRFEKDILAVLGAESMRSLAPPAMNVTVSLVDYRRKTVRF